MPLFNISRLTMDNVGWKQLSFTKGHVMDLQSLEEFLINLRDQEISEIVFAMQDWLIQRGKTVRDADFKTLVRTACRLKEGGEEFIKKNLHSFINVISNI